MSKTVPKDIQELGRRLYGDGFATDPGYLALFSSPSRDIGMIRIDLSDALRAREEFQKPAQKGHTTDYVDL